MAGFSFLGRRGDRPCTGRVSDRCQISPSGRFSHGKPDPPPEVPKDGLGTIPWTRGDRLMDYNEGPDFTEYDEYEAALAAYEPV